MLTIKLDQTAIEEAITNFIGDTTLGVDLNQKEVSIKLIAGRGGNGWRAEVNIASQGNNPETSEEENTLSETSDSESSTTEESSESVVEPFDFDTDED